MLSFKIAAFAAILLVSGYLGLAKITIPAIGGYQQSDKGLHLITFFILTVWPTSSEQLRGPCIANSVQAHILLDIRDNKEARITPDPLGLCGYPILRL